MDSLVQIDQLLLCFRDINSFYHGNVLTKATITNRNNNEVLKCLQVYD